MKYERKDIEYAFGCSCHWSTYPSIAMFDCGIGFVKIYKASNQNSTQSSRFFCFWFMKTLNLGWSSFFCRKITIEILRLLYGVGYGHFWFGRWGYRFCRGRLEWQSTVTIKLLKFLPHWNLTKLSKILVTQTNTKKSSR